MARTGFGAHADHGRIVGRQYSGAGIELKLSDVVAAQTRVQDVAVGGIGEDRVRVRLAGDHLLRGLNDAIGADRMDRDLAAAIGGAEQKFAAAVGGDIGHGIGERPAADKTKLAGFGIDGEGRRAIGLVAQADIEEALVRADAIGVVLPGLAGPGTGMVSTGVRPPSGCSARTPTSWLSAFPT